MGAKIHHVKLHGALYNDCAKDINLSKIFIQTIQSIDPLISIYGLSGSCTIQQAILLGQPFYREAFADRTYQNNGQLTPRYLDNAMIENANDASAQVLRLIKENKVELVLPSQTKEEFLKHFKDRITQEKKKLGKSETKAYRKQRNERKAQINTN